MARSALPRCAIIPLPDSQVSLQVDGVERLRWHFGPDAPRPFFFPLVGPSGASLVRMGHPGAPNHDHHRGIWFAHHSVAGEDFWSDTGDARIRQLQWYCYEDGDQEARFAVQLGWFGNGTSTRLVEQEFVAAMRPLEQGETLLELQSTFYPRSEQLEFGKTNFGMLGVRVAKSLSVYFGDGVIADSEGRKGEPAIFGQAARWVDYHGSVGVAHCAQTEGITYFDHPDNPGYPARWHVREDGWMIAAACMEQPLMIMPKQPLTLRYLLHAHHGAAERERANAVARQFASMRPFRLSKSARKHTAYELNRLD